MSVTKTLVVGVGSRIRGDDMVGPYTIDILKEKMEAGKGPGTFELELLDVDVMPENFSKPIKGSGADIVFFVDAVDMGLDPGELRMVPRELIDATIPCSHNLPLSYLMGYIGERIEKVELLGIQIERTGLFDEMTEGSREACRKLADVIWENRALELALYSKEEGKSERKCDFF